MRSTRRHLGEQLGDDVAAVEVAAVVAVAVDAEAAPWARSGRSGRRRCETPKSGEHDDQMAPIEAVARKPIRASGSSACRRRRGRRARPRARAGRRRSARPRSRSSPQVISPSSRRSEACRIASRSAGLAGEHVLGVVEPRAGNHRRRASRGSASTARRAAVARDVEVLPDRGPELVERVDRPAPQRLVVAVERRGRARPRASACTRSGSSARSPPRRAPRASAAPFRGGRSGETSISSPERGRVGVEAADQLEREAVGAVERRGVDRARRVGGQVAVGDVPSASRQVIPIERQPASRGGTASPPSRWRSGAAPKPLVALGVGFGDRLAELDQAAVQRVADHPAGAGLEADVAAADRVDVEEEGRLAVELACGAADERPHALLTGSPRRRRARPRRRGSPAPRLRARRRARSRSRPRTRCRWRRERPPRARSRPGRRCRPGGRGWGGAAAPRSRSESTPAIRRPSSGTSAASDQNRIRNGPSGTGRDARSGAARAARRGAKRIAPVRAASRWALRSAARGAAGRRPGETTFCEARRKNSDRTR